MKEREPRLTRQSDQFYTGREGGSMQEGPDQPESGGGVATEERLTPETAADRVEAARRRSEAAAAARNILSSLTPEQREAFREQLLAEEGLSLEGLGVGRSRKEIKDRSIKFLTNKEERYKYFDKFFSLVDATPHEFFGNVWNRNLRRIAEYDDFIDLISSGATGDLEGTGISLEDLGLDQKPPEELEKFREELANDLIRYQVERQMREYLHDVNAALYVPSLKAKQLYEHMQQFDSKHADLAWRTPGVVQMANIYEQVLREDMAKNEGYLRPEAVLGDVDTQQTEAGQQVVINVQRGEVEKETRKRFMDMVDRGEIVMRNQKGEAVVLKKEDFEQWQLDKVFTLAKGMSIVNLRLISIAAESRIPKGTGRYTSLFLQDMIATFSPFVHLLGKYQIVGQGLTPYLYKSEKAKKFLGMLTQWDPTTLKGILDKFEEGPEGLKDLLDSPEFFYIQKLNPNRAGDIFTWLSWRASEDDSVASMMQRFVKRGRERMRQRWDLKNPTVKSEEYEKIIKKYKLLKEEFISSEDKEGTRVSIEKEFEEKMNSEWAGAHPGNPSISEYQKFIDEYENWIGTGLRFERLRSALEKLNPDKPWEEQKAYWESQKARFEEKVSKEERKGHKHQLATKDLKKAKDTLSAMEKADKILGRMVSLQPHRLYLKSIDIRKRIGVMDDEKLSRVMKNLALVEGAFLRDRENLLKQGKTFADVSLDFSILPESERQEAMDFANKIREDFDTKRAKYYEEFVLRREFKHGFVLWDGDAPKDEFNFTGLGATGVVRRARDNVNQEEAWTEEAKLLDNVEHIKTPDDLVKLLEAIHKKIDDYDKAKAQISTAEKAEAFARFFAEASFTKIPVFGMIEKIFGDHVSMAKIVYGTEAPAWGSTEIRSFFQKLEHGKLITKEQYENISGKFATIPDVVADFGVTWTQLITLAIALYLITRLLKEK